MANVLQTVIESVHHTPCECVVRATTQVNGKTGNSTPAMPKPLNRSSPKVPHVISSRISTHMQNLVTIPQGVSFPRLRKIAHQKCFMCFFGFFHRKALENHFCPGKSWKLKLKVLESSGKISLKVMHFSSGSNGKQASIV